MQDQLEQLIYTSVGTNGLDAGDVFKIVETAARNNADREITGLLVFVNGCFFQAIEGPGWQLEALLRILKRDPRHHSMSILKRRAIDKRQFPCWRMRRVSVADQDHAWLELKRILGNTPGAETILSEFERFLSHARFAA